MQNLEAFAVVVVVVVSTSSRQLGSWRGLAKSFDKLLDQKEVVQKNFSLIK